MRKYEAAVISAYTGVLIGEFSEMHKYVETLLNRPVFTHELADKGIQEKIKELSKPDFLKIHNDLDNNPMGPSLGNINQMIQVAAGRYGVEKGEISDGTHTFNDLYDHRVMLFLALIGMMQPLMQDRFKCWFSDTHFDGEKWDGWIIVGIIDKFTMEQVSYHMKASFEPYLIDAGVEKFERGVQWDGHDSDKVLERLSQWFYGVPFNKNVEVTDEV